MSFSSNPRFSLFQLFDKLDKDKKGILSWEEVKGKPLEKVLKPYADHQEGEDGGNHFADGDDVREGEVDYEEDEAPSDGEEGQLEEFGDEDGEQGGSEEFSGGVDKAGGDGEVGADRQADRHEEL